MKYYKILVPILVPLLLLSFVSKVTAQDVEMTEDHPYARIACKVIETFWNTASTPQEMYMLEAEAFADHYVLHSPFSDTSIETINGAITMHKLDVDFKRLENMSVTVDKVFTSDETATVIAHIQATPVRLWALANGYYLPASEQLVTWQHVSIFHFNDDGLIDEEWIFIGMPDVEKFDR